MYVYNYIYIYTYIHIDIMCIYIYIYMNLWVSITGGCSGRGVQWMEVVLYNKLVYNII